MSKKDDHSEFLRVLNDCRGTIMYLCMAYSGRDVQRRCDLYQEVVSNLWSSFARFDHRCSPSTWAYRVALNTINSYERRRGSRFWTNQADSLLLAEMPDINDNPLTERLYELIEYLSPDDKALILLYLDRKSQKEMAEVFNLSESTINHRIIQIKKQLKQLNENERY